MSVFRLLCCEPDPGKGAVVIPCELVSGVGEAVSVGVGSGFARGWINPGIGLPLHAQGVIDYARLRTLSLIPYPSVKGPLRTLITMKAPLHLMSNEVIY